MAQIAERSKLQQWFIPFPGSDQPGADARPHLLRVCQGNEILERVLNYWVYWGSVEAAKQGLVPGECAECMLYREHQQILDELKKVLKISRKTLRRYLAELKHRGLVTFTTYGKWYTVHFAKISELIATPPAAFVRAPRSSFFQSGPSGKSEPSAKVVKVQNGKGGKSTSKQGQQSHTSNESEPFTTFKKMLLDIDGSLLPLFESAIEAAVSAKVEEVLKKVVEGSLKVVEGSLKVVEVSLFESARQACEAGSPLKVNPSRFTRYYLKDLILPYGCADAHTADLDLLVEDLPYASKQASYSRHYMETVEPVATGSAVPEGTGESDKTVEAVQPSMFAPDVLHFPQREPPAESTLPSSKASAVITKLPVGKNAGKGKGKDKGATTGKEKPTRTPKTETVMVLTADEQRVFDFYCQLWFITIPPKISETKQQHCATLAPHVQTLEDMIALEKVARRELKSLGVDRKVLELGNLVNSLNAWKADTMLVPEDEQSAATASVPQGQRRDDRRPASSGYSLLVPDEIAAATMEQRIRNGMAKLDAKKAKGEAFTTIEYRFATRHGYDVTGVTVEEETLPPMRAAAN